MKITALTSSTTWGEILNLGHIFKSDHPFFDLKI
jgi:hypothetical protein